ncbi:DUF2147 domain-containing protein [Plastorhodobacter daqingensis]|uniref:DUF2147 domain-containing protein n=1 Tax=Plastorhodobacter daqingensis TaxID=1387281 RepID=A0ABW2UHL0_9RHOB
MIRKSLMALTLTAPLIATPAFAQDPAEGIWTTQPDNNGNYGTVQILPCENRICGVLTGAFDGSGAPLPSENIGRAIVWDMQPRGDGSYENGKVFSPDQGRTYNAKMALRGDQLGVAGCVLGFCREQTWTRAR